MLTAKEFWSPAKRTEFNAHRQADRYTAHWLPAQFRRMPEGRSTGKAISSGPHRGFHFHEEWPCDLRVMRSCRKDGDREAQRVLAHNGWYTDDFMDNVIYACAVKIRIPRRQARREGIDGDSCHSNGQPTRVRWAEATESSDWGQIYIARRKCDIHDTMEDAIRGADRAAELSAKQAREEDAKDQANQQADALRLEIDGHNDVIASCQKELEDLCPSHEFASKIMNDRILEELSGITKAEARIAALSKDFWLAAQR